MNQFLFNFGLMGFSLKHWSLSLKLELLYLGKDVNQCDRKVQITTALMFFFIFVVAAWYSYISWVDNDTYLQAIVYFLYGLLLFSYITFFTIGIRRIQKLMDDKMNCIVNKTAVNLYNVTMILLITASVNIPLGIAL